MNNKQQLSALIGKVFDFENRYKEYAYAPLSEPMGAEIFETMENLYTPPKSDWRPIAPGEKWGKEWSYAWFKAEFTVPEDLNGRELFFTQDTGAVECLIYINGKCCGEFDNSREDDPNTRLHRTKLLTKSAKAGEKFIIELEGYNGHLIPGTQPYEEPPTDIERFDREYRGITILEMNRTVYDFLLNSRIVNQLYRLLPDDNFQKGRIAAALEQIFALVPQRPVSEAPWEECEEALRLANGILEELLKEKSGDDSAFAGLVGHSHLDTAWLWPMAETVRKAARTFSNALAMMELYDEYTFIASSPFHYEWMKDHYPDLFEGIKQRVAEGRWEPNGGAYVETDCNITGGEMMIRQFIKGQRFTREHFGYTADTFWLPDTFGYSASIPQLMLGCGMKYFVTTKLSWNETNTFPYDTFMWRGVDGSEVLTHFPQIHFWPDPESIKKNVYQHSRHKKITDQKLLAYGFGDGGGGPSKEMIDVTRKVSGLCGIPKSKHTTVSKFLNELAATAKDVPTYDGELYVEGHRGTLTSMHSIKRLNRQCEFALRGLEIVSVAAGLYTGAPKPAAIEPLYNRFYPNQFHDILPGSSIARVHDEATVELGEIFANAEKETANILNTLVTEDAAVTLYNPLSWERADAVTLDGEIGLQNQLCQTYTDLSGNTKTVISGIEIPGMAAVSLRMGTPAQNPSPFKVEGKKITTPFALVAFNDNGEIESFVDTESGRELRAAGGLPLNAFLTGDDVPLAWDTWNTDADQALKMKPCAKLLSQKVVSNGGAQLRIRSEYEIPRNSKLVQDIVFYANTPRVDFETKVDWDDKHRLLKTAFALDVVCGGYRSEIQYGFLERAAYRDNNEYEQAKFEVCNHKWTDLSENRFGVALLNDCKYGVAVNGSVVALTLLKGGIRPDVRGDAGCHEFTYSLLPHSSGFGAESVIRPAYELNAPVFAAAGSLKQKIMPLIEIDRSNVICEAVKYAEEGEGLVFRLYECEKSGTKCRVKFGFPFKKVTLTNMLEDVIEEITCDSDGSLLLNFRALEIITIKVI